MVDGHDDVPAQPWRWPKGTWPDTAPQHVLFGPDRIDEGCVRAHGSQDAGYEAAGQAWQQVLLVITSCTRQRAGVGICPPYTFMRGNVGVLVWSAKKLALRQPCI
jgi:hypothetical protein